MCLGIPGRIVDLSGAPDLLQVDVAGTERSIHVGCLDGEPLCVGDWILVHSGIALEKIDEATARRSLAFLAEYTEDPPEHAWAGSGGSGRGRG